MVHIIPLYILGLLQRFGPQHGYQIKKIIAEQLSDFTQIKLPTIYYHLEKMEADGLLFANREKPGSRPEKTIYAVTDKGMAAFMDYLHHLLAFSYRPVFPHDGVFYFSDYLDTEALINSLKALITDMEEEISELLQHKTETLAFIPRDMQLPAEIVFSHHEHHYRAELDWALKALKTLSGEDEGC